MLSAAVSGLEVEGLLVPIGDELAVAGDLPSASVMTNREIGGEGGASCNLDREEFTFETIEEVLAEMAEAERGRDNMDSRFLSECRSA